VFETFISCSVIYFIFLCLRRRPRRVVADIVVGGGGYADVVQIL
jgi:hypothetical protein